MPLRRRFAWRRAFFSSTPPRLVLLSLVVWSAAFIAAFAAFSQNEQSGAGNSGFHLRRLLSTDSNSSGYYDSKCRFHTVNSSMPKHKGPAWESCVVERQFGIAGRVGFIVLYIFLTLVLFIAMAIICDDFFVPSLEAISETLNLSEDVAGATFMAAGSSAPELFSSIAAVTFDSDVGVGTITGSAVFNLLVIIALTAAFAGKELFLDWRPLIRDSTFYAVSIGFFIFAVWDTLIQVWEAVILLLLYALYIITMVVNSKLMDLMTACSNKCCTTTVEPSGSANITIPDNGPATESSNCSTQGRAVTLRRASMISRGSTRSSDSRVFKHHRRSSVIQGPRASIPRSPDCKYSFENMRTQIPQQSPERDPPSVNSSQRLLNGLPTPPTSPSAQVPPPEPGPDAQEPGVLFRDGDDNNNASLRASLPPLHEARRPNGHSILPPITKTSDIPDGFIDGPKPTNEPRRSRATLRSDAEEINMEALKEEQVETAGSDVGRDEEEEEEEEEEESAYIECCCACCPPIRGAPPANEELLADASASSRIQKYALLVLKWIIFILAFPFIVMFSYTIPDCSKSHNRRFYLLSFFMSVLWIAGISFCMVTIVARTGCLINVDTFVMSLVFLAAGTSIPDLLSSIIVARDGYADMAVSNAIGSNVFDINLGLGLPFLIRIISNLGEPFSVFSVEERTAYCKQEMKFLPHPKFGFILLLLLAISLTVFGINRFRLNKGIGICFFVGYILFLVYAFLQEFLCGRLYNC